METTINLDQLHLAIVPGNLVQSPEHVDLYNKSYDYYRKTWERIMSRLNKTHGFEVENFYKNHFITNLFFNDQIVAQICCRVLDFSNHITYDLPYFKDFEGEPLDFIKKNNIKSLLSFEWNSVNREFSTRKTHIPLVEISIQLTTNLCRRLQLDGCCGVPRKITGVQEYGKKIGFKSVKENIIKYGCPVEVIIAPIQNLKPHEDQNIQQLVDKIWSERTELDSLSNIFSKSNKKTNQTTKPGESYVESHP